jgi:hypothetical protein
MLSNERLKPRRTDLRNVTNRDLQEPLAKAVAGAIHDPDLEGVTIFDILSDWDEIVPRLRSQKVRGLTDSRERHLRCGG